MARLYRFTKFIIGIDCEKIPMASFTGYNTRNNELLRLDFRKLGTNPGNAVQRIYTVLHADMMTTFISKFGVVIIYKCRGCQVIDNASLFTHEDGVEDVKSIDEVVVNYGDIATGSSFNRRAYNYTQTVFP